MKCVIFPENLDRDSIPDIISVRNGGDKLHSVYNGFRSEALFSGIVSLRSVRSIQKESRHVYHLKNRTSSL